MKRAKKVKSDDYVKLYEVYSRFPSFPEEPEGQREIVKKFHNVVYCEGGIIKVEDAKDERIYFVSKSIWEKARRIIEELSMPKKRVLEFLSQIKMVKENNPHDPRIASLEERISIVLEGNKIDNVESGINEPAYNILGYSLNSKYAAINFEKL